MINSQVSELSGNGTRENRRLSPAAVLAVVCIIFSVIRLWIRPGLADWDILGFYLPWYAHLGESIRSFDIPGWNPYIASGTPFAGDPQSGWWYFPVMLLFTVFPPVLAFKLSIVLQLLLATLAAYWLARLLGTGTFGAWCAGMVFGFGANFGVATCCTIFLQVAPWLPIGLIGIELGIRQERWRTRLALLLISSFALSQLAGAWIGQGMYNGFLLIGAYLVWRWVVHRPGMTGRWSLRFWETGIAAAWMFGAGLLFAAAGLLPRFDSVRRAHVGSSAYLNNVSAIAGLEWWQVIQNITFYRRDWFPYYIGGAMLALAVIGLIRSGAQRQFAFFGIWAAVIIILPMKPTPLHQLFYLLPKFRGMHLHDPSRELVTLPLAFAMLAGAGADILSRGEGRNRRWPPIAAGGLVVLVLLNPHRSWPWLTVSVVSAILVCIAFAIARWRSTHIAEQTSMAIVLFALILDPAGYFLSHQPILISPSASANAISVASSADDQGGAGEFLQQLQEQGEIFRYYGFAGPDGPGFQIHEHFAEDWVLALLTTNRSMRLGLEDVQGYNPANLQRYLATFAAINGMTRDYHEALVYRQGIGSPVLDMLNACYVIIPNDSSLLFDDEGAVDLPSGYTLVFSNDTVSIYKNPNALPRAWIVHSAVEQTDTVAVDMIASGEIDPRTTAVVEVTPPALSAITVADTDQVRVTKNDADTVELIATTSNTGMLVLGDAYDPNWTVTVDGKASQFYAVNTILRGVVVGEGTHTIIFKYQPVSLRAGFAVSIVSIAAALAFVGWCVLDQRRRKLRTSAIV